MNIYGCWLMVWPLSACLLVFYNFLSRHRHGIVKVCLSLASHTNQQNQHEMEQIDVNGKLLKPMLLYTFYRYRIVHRTSVFHFQIFVCIHARMEI